MENAVIYAMKAFINLNATEREEFIKQVNEYLKSGSYDKRQINESIEKSLQRTGPLSLGTCPVCGK